MTAQEPDSIEVAGVRYALTGIDGAGLFDPAGHGVVPRPISTGCWRGFVCGYAVGDDDAFRLARLRLGAGSEIGGAPVTEGTPLLGAPAVRAGGEWTFAYDALVVPFTGTLLCGEGFVRSTYVHMGFAPAWKFERVLELAVDAGRVTARRDLSEQMAATRARIEADAAADPDGDRRDPGWIARTFRLGYDRSVPRPPSPPTP